VSIIGLDEVTLTADDLEAGKRFLRDFGLQEIETGAHGATFHARDGTGLRLRKAGDRSLPAARGSGPNFHEAIWGVRDKAALEEIGARLGTDRDVKRGSDGVLRTTDGDGNAIAFQVSQRRAFEAAPSLVNVPGRAPARAANRTADYASPIRPCTFMRAPGSADHHNLFFIRRPEMPTAGLNHIAFHVRDATEVMLGGMALVKKGWQTAWGPGRHIFGSNHFWYFKSPFGGNLEYDADMDVVDDSWQPREALIGPDTAAIWQTDYPGTHR